MSATTIPASRAAASSRSASRARLWLRATAVILAFFAVGHTVGTAVPRVTHGAEEEALFRAMQGFRFPVMGFTRSYWEFYRGFSVTISVLLAALAVFAWQLGNLSRRNPAATLPLAATMLASCLATAVVTFVYFFSAPMFLSALAVLISANAVRLVARDAKSN